MILFYSCPFNYLEPFILISTRHTFLLIKLHYYLCRYYAIINYRPSFFFFRHILKILSRRMLFHTRLIDLIFQILTIVEIIHYKVSISLKYFSRKIDSGHTNQVWDYPYPSRFISIKIRAARQFLRTK